ncbi:MAG: flagellar motor protein MotB [Chitinophagales bacterium]
MRVYKFLILGWIALTFGSCGSATQKLYQLNNDMASLQKELGEVRQQNTAFFSRITECEEEAARLLNENDRMGSILEEMPYVSTAYSEETRLLTLALEEVMRNYEQGEIKLDIEDNNMNIIVANHLLYPIGDARIDKKGKATLTDIADALLDYPNHKILVEGHTDNLPIKNRNYRDNWELSVTRAANVVRYLENEGIDPKRLVAKGYGEFHPIATNATKEGQQLNRRTEIVIVAPK